MTVVDDFAGEVNDKIDKLDKRPSIHYAHALMESEGLYTVALPADIVTDGIYVLSVDNTNTTVAVRFFVNGNRNVYVKKIHNGALSDLDVNDLQPNIECLYRYNGTYFILENSDALTLNGKGANYFAVKDDVYTKLETYTADETDTLLNNKAPKHNPIFTGTVQGITKSMVGLDEVDNTPDIDKDVATAKKLAVQRKISLTGDVTGEVSFDGSKDVAIGAKVENLGTANGIATLDKYGKLIPEQKPCYTADEIAFEDGETFQNKYDSGELTGGVYYPEFQINSETGVLSVLLNYMPSIPVDI